MNEVRGNLYDDDYIELLTDLRIAEVQKHVIRSKIHVIGQYRWRPIMGSFQMHGTKGI